MEYEYGGWFIDSNPDFSLGRFFARARLTRVSPDDEPDAEMHIERNLAWFDSKEEAIQAALQWSIRWIDARDKNLASADADSSTQRNDMLAQTPAT